MYPVRLAFDVGPLHGHRTGIGAAVAHLADALGDRDDLVLSPYLLSFRARPTAGVRRLPMPAAAAHRMWARSDHPTMDRWLEGTDVVHGTNYVVPPTRRPAVVSVYDCWFLRQPERAAPAVRRAGEVLRRRVAAGASVHTSSAATASWVTELLGTKDVHVVHLGPLDVPASPTYAPAGWLSPLHGVPYVLSVGTIERRKNTPGLVRAFAGADLPPEVRLVLAGAPGDDADALDEAIDAQPVAVRSRVMRPGAVDGATKAWLLHHATVVAYPSLDEGFGFPILEAQQVGVPIVASSAGSIPEVAGAGAALVPVGDDDALGAALVTTIDDQERRRELVAAGHANVARFSWSATADAMVALYHQLLEDR
ncbi:MAG: glycosyltransferase family 1 protein [Ilumatobacteraceae bacterium]